MSNRASEISQGISDRVVSDDEDSGPNRRQVNTLVSKNTMKAGEKFEAESQFEEVPDKNISNREGGDKDKVDP